MLATIYHADQTIFRDTLFYMNGSTICPVETVQEFWPTHYYVAGTVEITDYHDTFEASQNLDSGWGDGNQRSTSVGDIVESDGRYYIVAPVGYDPIDLPTWESACV